MATMGNITVFDGAATPVVHTLLPVDVTREGGKTTARWRENAAGVPTIAQVTMSLTLSKSTTGVYKVERKVVVPVMESISGQNSSGYTAAPKVAHELTDIHTSFFHERSDTASRRLVRQLGINVDGNISTTVTPQTSGYVPDAFDLLINPT